MALARDQISTLMIALAASGCAAAVRAGEERHRPPPSSDLGEHHPLRGRIWDVQAAAFIDSETLGAQLARQPYVLLGEKHDNPEHHRLQALLLQALVDRQRRPAVVWEMIPLAKQPVLERWQGKGPELAAQLGAALEWEGSGWPPWPLYQPIVEVALAARLPLRAAGLDRERLLALMHAKLGALAPETLSTPLPAAAAAELAAEIRQAHCGHSSPLMEEKMVLAQQIKDALMARRLLGLAEYAPPAYAAALAREMPEATEVTDGAVLIAGNGHVRRDRGVPHHLRALAPTTGQLTAAVGILEVQEGQLQPVAYAQGAGPQRAYDFLLFTARVNNDDPCERFRQRLEKLREQQGTPGGED